MRSSRLIFIVLSGALLGGAIYACANREAAPDNSLQVFSVLPTTHLPPPTTTSTTTAPAPPTTTTHHSKGWLVIHGTGDVNLDPSYIPALVSRGYDWAWSGLDGLFLQDDLTIVNLECSPSTLGEPEPKDFTFRCADGLHEMAEAGIEVANLGNNHSQDFGKEAMLDGRAHLIEAGLVPVGAGADASQANAPALFDVEGWRVAIVGFGGIRPHDGWIATESDAGMADGDTIESMVAAVESADRLADWVIVTVHWGIELDLAPDPGDIERAQALISAGADAIFGHHAHRLQRLEIVDGVPVAWNLGNFVWPNLSPAGSRTGIARMVVSPDGDVTGCLIPALIESAGHPVLTGEPECGAPA
ncbi:MAG: CapA family protein [Acidimicrobiia bacterium]